MNVSKFLSSGETTLYSSLTGKMLSIGGTLAITLTIAALSGCSSVADTRGAMPPFDLSGLTAQRAQAHTVGLNGYSMDGPTLLYQAMVDPSMHVVTVASSTSQFLGQFVSSQPASVRMLQGNRLRDSNPAALAELMNKNTQAGLSTSIANADAGLHGGASACLILTRGLGSGFSNSELQQDLMSNPESLNMSSLNRSMAYVAIHESAHCLPFTMMAEPPQDGGLEYAYFSSLRELRSDLAVVLFTASQTGSFEDGLVMVGSMRGVASEDMTHSDFGMLKVVVAELDPSAFRGSPLHDLSSKADEILSRHYPATNEVLRRAFAREALTNIAISGTSSRLAAAQAQLNFAGFVGEPFSVDLRVHARETIDLALDNALRSADAVRLSGLMTGSKVQAYAKLLGGGDLSSDQIEKVMFLDGSVTPTGVTASANGRVAVQPSSLDMEVLKRSVSADLARMIAGGAIQSGPGIQAAARVAPSAVVDSLSSRLSLGFEAMDKAVDRGKELGIKILTGSTPGM